MTRKKNSKLTRRRLLQGAGVAAAATAMPHVWIPREVKATSAFDTAKHLVYIRLSGGFRFPTAFNGDNGEQFNPFGTVSAASGTEWGVGRILDENEWLTEEIAAMGVRRVPDFTNEMAVLTCVDHEPLSGSADGNHQTGLERFLTGYVGGSTGLFTMLNYGLRERNEEDALAGIIKLPAIVMGETGMGLGAGEFGAYRPAVLRGDDLDRFASGATDQLPEWAKVMSDGYDLRNRDRVNVQHFPVVDAYIRSREATKAYADIFASDILKVGEGSQEVYDGVSNADLQLVFGQGGAGQNAHLALRLFHFGCPAVYIDQGGYDMHSDEEMNLPIAMQEFNQMLAGLEWALKRMDHPEGGKYWDHTVVMVGSEFSRTTRGGRFNSARGSDHGGDYATRWMSMPFMGGPIGAKGRKIGSTNPADLADQDLVFSYRAVWKTMMDVLGADHTAFFPADEPFEDLFG
jgi:truncated hemoglobin YjbI